MPEQIADMLARVQRMGQQQFRVEQRWFPIDSAGEAWGPRPEAECDALIEDHARPDHYLHEPHNSDMTRVVAKRGEWREVGPWLPIPASTDIEEKP